MSLTRPLMNPRIVNPEEQSSKFEEEEEVSGIQRVGPRTIRSKVSKALGYGRTGRVFLILCREGVAGANGRPAGARADRFTST